MKKVLVISLATGALLLAGCKKDEPVVTQDTDEVVAEPTDGAATDAPAEKAEPAKKAE
jgi:uncharacterized protein YcfL